jgi:hypothetical protein
MSIGLPGSVQVRVGGAAVPVPAARQRALLAVLAVRAGELVRILGLLTEREARGLLTGRLGAGGSRASRQP